ncbi:MAG TPA: oligoendopeptidase, partial [Candidatus Paenibacillus intestinavium]|nr:oligoendopeptidase [Candidatus Paenibacillus intestinavium]
MKYTLKWELDSIYEGGSQSAQLKQEIVNTDALIKRLHLDLSNSQADQIEQIINQTDIVQQILLNVRQMDSFVSCLMAQDMFDKQAVALLDRVKNLNAAFTAVLTKFDNNLRSINDEQWERYLSQPALQPIA